MSATVTTYGPTEKQVSFYNVLAAERGLPTIEAFAEGTTRKQASKAIDALMAIKKPKKGQAAPVQAAPVAQAVVPVQMTLTATGEPALVGKIVHIPYADSCATYKVTGIADGFAELTKATTAD